MNAGERSLSKRDAAVMAALAVLPFLLFTDALTGRRVFYERDIHAYWYPKVEALVRVVAAGAWPFWDPNAGFGQPLFADPASQVLYPFTWLNLVVLPATAYTVIVAAHCWLAAAGAYVLGRRWGLSPPAAAACGVCFGASGPFLSAVSLYHHYMGAAWMPWVLVALEAALVRPTLGAVTALAATAALQVLAGSGDMVVLTALAALVRVVAIRVPSRARAGATVSRLLLAAGLALGLSAAQWVPTVALLRRSSRASMPAAANLYWSVHPAVLVELFLPRALPSLPLSEPVRAALFESREPFLPSLYLGLVPALALVPLAGTAAPRRALVAAAACAFFMVAALGRHTPLLPVLLAVPGLSWFRYPVKYTIGLALFWALLAGLGVEAWLAPWSARERRCGRLVAAGAVVLALAALGGGQWVRLHAVDLGRWVDAPPDWRPLAYAPLVAVLRRAGAVALAVAAIVAVRVRHDGYGGRVWGAVLVAAVALDLVTAGRGVNDLAPRELVRHRPPVLDLLPGRPDAHRVFTPTVSTSWLNRSLVRGPAGWEPEWSWALGLQEGLQAPIGERWGLRGSYEADFTGLAPSPLPVLSSMMARYQESALGVRLLTLGGVTEVVALRRFHAPGLFPAGEVPTVFAEPVRVFRVPAPLPRVYVVARARTVTGDDALRALGDPGFDPGTSVILDSASSLADGDGPAGTAGIVEARPDHWRIATRSPRGGHLVVLDAYDPSWSATVDGVPAPLRRANLVFRSVDVPAGTHAVEMRCRPRSAIWGMALSGLTLAALVAGALGRARPRRARVEPATEAGLRSAARHA